MRVSLACESPTAHIKLVQEHTEFDFAIAHFVRDPGYAAPYAERSLGRILILDNGKFELVHPLSPEEVIEAAIKVRADYVVPPDHFGNFEKTKDSLKDFIKRIWKGGKRLTPFKIAPVVVGRDPGELARCYDYYITIPEIDMYCISFLTNRISSLKMVRMIDKTKPHHLLGFSTRDELRQCCRILESGGLTNITLDTMKPVSATYHQAIVRDLGRGSYDRPKLGELLNETLLVDNIKVFKGWLQNL